MATFLNTGALAEQTQIVFSSAVALNLEASSPTITIVTGSLPQIVYLPGGVTDGVRFVVVSRIDTFSTISVYSTAGGNILLSEIPPGEQVEFRSSGGNWWPIGTSTSINYAQNLNAHLIENETWSWDPLSGDFSWSSPLRISLLGKADSSNEIAPGTVNLLDGQVAYIALNRLPIIDEAALPLVEYPENVPVEDETLIFARRDGDTLILAPSASMQNAPLHVQLVQGGQWAFSFPTNTLSWSDPAYLQTNRTLQKSRNTIAAGSAVLANDGDVAFVTFNISQGPADTLTPSVTASSTFVQRPTQYIFARRVGNEIVIGDSLTLRAGERAALSNTRTTHRARLVNTSLAALPIGTSALIDGVSVVNGDRVLFANSALNKLYAVTGVGTSLVWTPLAVFEGLETPSAGCKVFVTAGGTQQGTTWEFDAYGWTRSTGVNLEPSGFANRSDSTLAFNSGTRTLTLSPVLSYFEIYQSNVRRRYTVTQSTQIPDTAGLRAVYFDASGVLQNSAFSSDLFFGPQVLVALTYWDPLSTNAVGVMDMRAGYSTSGASSKFLYESQGAAVTGLKAGNFIINGTGAVTSDAQLSITDGAFLQPDLTVAIANNSPQTLSPSISIPVWYREGALGSFRKTASLAAPVKVGASRAQYNLFSTGTWSAIDAPLNNQFFAMWLYATADVATPVIAVLGQRVDNSLSDAQANNRPDLLDLGDLPSRSMKLLYRLIYTTSATFVNAPKAALRDVVDFRGPSDVSLSTFSPEDHGSLTGLEDQDIYARAILADTSGFNNLLTTADTNVQLALNTLQTTAQRATYEWQDVNAKLLGGGVWSWNSGTGVLSYAIDAFISIPGLSPSRNTVPAGTITLANDGDVAYVDINRAAGSASNLPVIVAASSTVTYAQNRLIIARRVGADVLVGRSSFRLINGQSSALDQGLSLQTAALLGSGVTPATSVPTYSTRGAPQRTIDNTQPVLEAISSIDGQIDKFFGQFRLQAHGTQLSKVTVTGVDLTMKDGAILSQEMERLILNFTGAVIDFSTGIVTAGDGVTALGLNFTPMTVPVGQFAWYSVLLVYSSTDASNRATAQIKVFGASAAGTTSTNAPLPAFVLTPKSKNLGAVQVVNNAGALQVNTIRQLGVGSGGGSSLADGQGINSSELNNNGKLAVELSATNAGLEFDAAGDSGALRVKPAAGITVTAAGVKTTAGALFEDTTPKLSANLDTNNFKVTTAVTNGSITLEPTGTGSIVLNLVGAGHLRASAAGDARGANAVDWQSTRSASSQVASGLAALIAGGANNTASANYSAVVGGAANTASALYAFASGRGNSAAHPGAIALGRGGATSAADDFILSNVDTDTSAAANVHFRVDGVSSDVHVGRGVNQALSAASTNRLMLHTVLANNQARATRIRASDTLSATYDLVLPPAQGGLNQLIVNDGNGILSWKPITDLITVTLQSAYDGGASIATNATQGDVAISGTEGLVVTAAEGIYSGPTAAAATGVEIVSSAATGYGLYLSHAPQGFSAVQIVKSNTSGVSSAIFASLASTAGGSILDGTISGGSNADPAIKILQNGTGSGLRLGGSSTAPRILLVGSTSGTLGISVAAVVASYNITLPAAQGAANTTLINDGNGNLSWAFSGRSGIEALAANLQVHVITLPVLEVDNKYKVLITLENLNEELPLPSDPAMTTAASPIVQITTAKAHGMLVGDSVTISGLTAVGGLTTGQINGTFTVSAVPSVTTFRYTSGASATGSGTGGGAAALYLPPADPNVNLYAYAVTAKSTTTFTVTLSNPTDSANYKLDWFVTR